LIEYRFAAPTESAHHHGGAAQAHAAGTAYRHGAGGQAADAAPHSDPDHEKSRPVEYYFRWWRSPAGFALRPRRQG
jgi:hypothetical protein